MSIPRCIALADELGIGRGERIGLIALMLQRVEFALQFSELSRRGARPVKFVCFLAQGLEPVADFR